jgi:hypothetical protein
VIHRIARIVAPVVALLLVAPLHWSEAEAATKPHFSFGVLSGTMRSAESEVATQRLLEAIGLEQQIAFVVYDGNLKSATERCDDALYETRQQVLQTSRAPLVFAAGQHDWAECDRTTAGGYDVAERLDFLRRTLFADNASLGQTALAMTHESEVTRFHAYRENVRWLYDDTVFVTLNVVGGNNHYLNAGGRNGEYDDRAIATAFWLEHAAEFARRHGAHALVVFVQANPNFQRYERAERFSWIEFGRERPRDGYLEFKRSLVKAAQTFRGPVIVIHPTSTPLARGFAIDQPLFNDKGDRLSNLTRIAISPREVTTQWVNIDVNFAKTPPFLVSIRQIPKSLPDPPAAPLEPALEPMPAITPRTSGVTPAAPPVPLGAPTFEPPLLPESPGGAPSTDNSMQGGS